MAAAAHALSAKTLGSTLAGFASGELEVSRPARKSLTWAARARPAAAGHGRRGKGFCYAAVATDRAQGAAQIESFMSTALQEAMIAAKQALVRSPPADGAQTEAEAESQFCSLDTDAPCSAALPESVSAADIVSILPGGARQPSVYTQQAEAAFKVLEGRWQLQKFDYFRRLAMAMASYTYASSASAERLAAAAAHVAFLYFLDDLCFDVDTDAMAQEELNGIERDVLKSAPKVGQFLTGICNILRALEPPPNPSPVETALWELGCQLRRLSTPDWFDAFAGAVEDCIFATIALQSDLGFSIQDMESFTHMRVHNASYVNCAMLVELTNDAMLPPEARAHPTVQKLTWTAAAWGTFVNDIFSFDSEVVAEGGHSFNLIAMLKRTEGGSWDEALRRAVVLVNSYTHAFRAIEAELPRWESKEVDSTVRRYVHGLKELMAGGLHFHSTNDRYRWPDLRALNETV